MTTVSLKLFHGLQDFQVDRAMPMLADILKKGYFPAELPPCFDTLSYAASLTRGGALPRGFGRPTDSRLGKFSLARAGNSRFRRGLSLVNPTNYFELASVVANHWGQLEAKMLNSRLSQSRAVYRANQARALSPLSYSPSNLLSVRARMRGTARVLLSTDIAQFYDSIYTHSIPWAMHTKAFAKANRRANVAGNLLDQALQKAQDGQTVGIPIGPDISLVIAELLLTDLESRVRSRIPKLAGFRFVDDFELSFPDQASAERALAVLQEELLYYELRINGRKTAIQTPPVSLEMEWVSELRRFPIRSSTGQRGDIVGYFDLMTKYLSLHPDEHITKYGLQRFKTFTPRPENVEILQALLCHTCVAAPGATKEVVEGLLNLKSLNHPLDLSVIKEGLSAVLRLSTPLGHHYESAWALWGVIQFGIHLDRGTVAALSKTENSIVAILALDAGTKGLARNLDTRIWEARMTADDLRQEEWLLSYEANVQGWLPSVGGGDHVATDREFGFLKANNVNFYKP